MHTALNDFRRKRQITTAENIWPPKCKMPSVFNALDKLSVGYITLIQQLGFCFHFSPWKVPPCAVIYSYERGLLKNADNLMQEKSIKIKKWHICSSQQFCLNDFFLMENSCINKCNLNLQVRRIKIYFLSFFRCDRKELTFYWSSLWNHNLSTHSFLGRKGVKSVPFFTQFLVIINIKCKLLCATSHMSHTLQWLVK